jgi:hypothetical protein
MGGWRHLTKDQLRWEGNIEQTGEPNYPQDLATKKYVDDEIEEIDLSPYWKNDGTSTATGNWDIGANNFTTTGTISGGTLTDGTLSVTAGAITGASGSNSMWINDEGYLTSVAFADLSDYPADAAGVLTNDGAGNLSWGAGGGGGCSFGTDNQIPYTNAGGNDFDYSSKFKFDGTHCYLNGDNSKQYFGAGGDASIYYDGTDLIIKPDEVGSGYLSILGDVNLNANDLTTTGTLEAGAITGTSLIKKNGLSTEFLKADGSVDSSTYVDTTIAETNYVPYTGATTNIDIGYNYLKTDAYTITPFFVGGQSLEGKPYYRMDFSISGTDDEGYWMWDIQRLVFGSNFDDESEGYFYPVNSNFPIDLGLTGSRFRNLYLSGNADVNGTIKASGYISSDDSEGITTTFKDADGNTIGVKNGLIVSKTEP